MSQATLLDEARKSSAPASMPRSGAGTVVKPAERTTHYLHLSAITCERCRGPVLSGWIGRRADGITREERGHHGGCNLPELWIAARCSG